MHVAEIWRYPVKSMAGERLASAVLTAYGIPGDRIVQVRHANERVISARRAPPVMKATAGRISLPFRVAVRSRRSSSAVGRRL